MVDKFMTILDVKQRREELGMSLSATAAALGLSNARVYRNALEKAKREGAKPLQKSQLHRVATILCLDPIIVAPPKEKTARGRKQKPANGAEEPTQIGGAGGGIGEPPQEGECANAARNPAIDDAELSAIEAANRAAAWGAADITTGTIEEIAKKIDALVPADRRGKKLPADERLAAIKQMRPLLMAAHRLGAGAADRAVLRQAISDMLGIAVRDAKKLLDETNTAFLKEREKTPAQIAEEAAGERLALHAELWPKVKKIALDANLMQRVVDYAHAAGIVGEEAGILGLYLVGSSRLSVKKALSLLRRGAPSSGKNFAADIVLAMFPPEDVINLTGASPKALHYFGGADNTQALKHKILYVAEAAAIARHGGDEHEMTKALRTLIQEGYINYGLLISIPNKQSR